MKPTEEEQKRFRELSGRLDTCFDGGHYDDVSGLLASLQKIVAEVANKPIGYAIRDLDNPDTVLREYTNAYPSLEAAQTTFSRAKADGGLLGRRYGIVPLFAVRI